MSSKYNLRKTTILAELRQQADLTQDQAGAYFGLKGKKRRDSVGNWERGVERPHHRLRAQFITYLWRVLGLCNNPHLFEQTWQEVMVGQWQWLPLYRNERPAAEAPFQAIAAISYFVGRESELADLEAVLVSEGRSPTAVLHGIGGVGKTTLAAQAAYRLRPYFPDGILWARLDLSETLSILTSFAAAYGQDIGHYPDLDSRSRVVRGILANKQALIVLDNAHSSDQVEPLLPPTTGTCAVLVTTRQTNLPALLGARWLHVEPFSEKKGETIQLFARILGQTRVTKDRKSLVEAADLLGHLPLAIAIVAGRLQAESDRTVSDLLSQLRQEKERLGELIYGDWSIEAAFNVSYEGLTPTLQRCFVSLGVFGGRSFAADAVAAVTDTAVVAAQANLEKLCDFSLLQRGEPGRYQLHPLLQDYARGKIDSSAPFRRMAAYYYRVLQTANQLYEEGGEASAVGLALFDLERESIQAGQAWVAAQAKDEEEVLDLCCDYPLAGGFLLHLRLHPQETICWCEKGLAAARRRQRHTAEGRLLIHLGLAHYNLGQLEDSVNYYQQALPIFREDKDSQNACNVLDKLGLVYIRLGRFRQAVELLEKGLLIAREIKDRQREANILGNLGVAYKNLGELRQALAHQKESLAIAREREDFYGIGAGLCDLATVYLELNEPHRAITLYEEALPIVRQIGDLQTESNVLGNLGWAYASLKDFERAVDFYKLALTTDRQTGNRYGESITLNNLGETMLALGEPDQAIIYHKQALNLAIEVGARVSEGDALGGLGQAYQTLGQVARAIEFYQQALVHYELSDYPSGQAIQLQNLVSAYRQLGQEEAAKKCLEQYELLKN